VEKGNILDVLKQTFVHAMPTHDKRTTLSHLNFVSGFVFCFLGDTKTFSLEAIRRFMIGTFEIQISKGAFWERLSRNRLKNILHNILGELIIKTPSLATVGEEVLYALNVFSILLIDSSSISLWDGAKKDFPGTRMTAGIKWHACFNLLSGKMEWFSTTAVKVHDRKCFPPIEWLKGKLIIFDLGYWDFNLFDEIARAGGFFLSRVKSNAVVTVVDVVKGISGQLIGEKLSSQHLKKNAADSSSFLGRSVVKIQNATA